MQLNLPKTSGLFITGTDTGVGKTLIAGAIASILTEAGARVGVFKPVATGCRRRWEGMVSEDSAFLAACANSSLELTTITPIGCPTAAAPIVSAAVDNIPIDFQKIAAAYCKIAAQSDVMIVEGIGGVRVPLTENFDLLDLAAEMSLPMVIVARTDLGTINHTLMTLDCIRAAKLNIAGVVLNLYRPERAGIAEETCGQVIARCGRTELLATVPWDEHVDIERAIIPPAVSEAIGDCDWAALAGL